MAKRSYFNLLLVLLFFACNADDNITKLTPMENIQEVEQPETEDPIAEEPVIEEPEITEPEQQQPEEENNMKAVFLYDGSLKAFNKDKSLKVICDAETVCKTSNGLWIINNEVKDAPEGDIINTLSVNALKACVYGESFWHYGTDKKIYRDGEIIGDNKNNYNIALNSDGVAYGFTFYHSDGSFEIADSSFGFLIGNKIVGIAKQDKLRIAKLYIDGEWIEFARGLYADFYKYDALITDDKIIWTMGATLDLATMECIIPEYSQAQGKYIGGNAFVRYFIKRTEQRWQPVGYIEDMAYFFNPKTGVIYKYLINEDTLKVWIKIVDGTESNEITDNNELIEKTSVILVDNEIIYFDGERIQRVDVETGGKKEIAEATEFYGIPI